MRALDHVLAAMVIDVEAFAVCEIARDAQLVIERLTKIEVHYVLTGDLYLTVEDGAPRVLPQGSVVVVPPGHAHRLAAGPDPSIAIGARDVCSARADGVMRFDACRGDPGVVRVMCGQIHADMAGRFGVFDGMPEPIAASLGGDRFIRDAFAMISRELLSPGICSRTLCASLMRGCLVLLLRDHLRRGGLSGLPALFGSPWIGAVVAMILDHPARPYTVASLAAASGRGRSGFAREFAARTGIAPMEFVMRARLAQARALLTHSDARVSEIARMSGFASRSHFSTAFRRAFAMAPSACRRRSGVSGLRDGRGERVGGGSSGGGPSGAPADPRPEPPPLTSASAAAKSRASRG